MYKVWEQDTKGDSKCRRQMLEKNNTRSRTRRVASSEKIAFTTKPKTEDFFFLNYAARVITTVAVIELCYNCHC